MESKFENKLKKIEKCYIDDITFILNDIAKNYIMQDIDGNCINIDFLTRKYLSKYTNKVEYQCTAICNSSLKRCSMKSVEDYKFLYCKRHSHKINN